MPVNERVRALYRRDAGAKIAFDFLRGYQRNRNETTVSVLSWRAGLDDEAVKDFFAELENMGLGKYIPGRGSHPCRFRWALPVKWSPLWPLAGATEPL